MITVKSWFKTLCCLLFVFCISKQASALQCRSLFADVESQGIISRDHLFSLFGLTRSGIKFYSYRLINSHSTQGYKNENRRSSRKPLDFNPNGFFAIELIHGRTLKFHFFKNSTFTLLPPDSATLELSKNSHRLHVTLDTQFTFNPVTGDVLPSRKISHGYKEKSGIRFVESEASIQIATTYRKNLSSPPPSIITSITGQIENHFSTTTDSSGSLEWIQRHDQVVSSLGASPIVLETVRVLELEPVIHHELQQALHSLFNIDR